MRTPTCAKINSKNFTWTPNNFQFGGTFTIERSTLDGLGGLQQMAGTNSAVGFIMVSAKTGFEAEFRLTSITTDLEGDVVCWVLHPVFSSYNRAGGAHLQHIKVHVFNT